MNVTLAPTLQGQLATSCQYDVVLLPLLMLRETGCVVGLTTGLQQQPQSQIPPWAYANYAIGPLQVSFSFRVKPPTYLLICYCL